VLIISQAISAVTGCQYDSMEHYLSIIHQKKIVHFSGISQKLPLETKQLLFEGQRKLGKVSQHLKLCPSSKDCIALSD